MLTVRSCRAKLYSVNDVETVLAMKKDSEATMRYAITIILSPQLGAIERACITDRDTLDQGLHMVTQLRRQSC